MSALFLELARTVLFHSSSPLMFRLRMISSMVVLAPHGEVAKALHVVRLAKHKLLVSVDAVVGVTLITTSLADKPPWTTNMCLDRLNYLEKILSQCSDCTVLANRAGWRVPGDLMPQEAPDNSSCWVFVYLYDVVV